MSRETSKREVSSVIYDSLETFTLIWINSGNEKQEAKLRSIIAQTKVIESTVECQQFIKSSPETSRFVIIVDEQFSEELIPKIHDLHQISSIYIHCCDDNIKKKSNKTFAKIKTVTHNFSDILIQLSIDQTVRTKIEEPIAIRPFNIGVNDSSATVNFFDPSLHLHIMMDILLRMPFTNEDKSALEKTLKRIYKGNKTQVHELRAFQNHYSSSQALQWYIHKPFIQNVLSKAFLTENVEILYLFRSFIQDIFYELKRHQCQSPIRAYKGQLMLKSDLKMLKRSHGKLFTVNSLLLTDTDKERVIYNLKEAVPSKNCQQVLFEIDADPTINLSSPFAKVASIDGKSILDEVLFMTGSVFRVVSVRHDPNQICIIQLALCGHEDSRVKMLFQHIHNEYDYGQTNLLSFGLALRDFGKPDLAEKYLLRMLRQLPSDNQLLDALYPALGLIAKDKGDYQQCLHWHEKSLHHYMITRPFDYVTIADTYNSMGTIYHGNENQHERALEYYNKAVLLFKQHRVEMHPMMALFYDNIGAVHEEQKSYPEALVFYQRALDVRKKHLPPNHLDMSKSFKNIAAAHGYLGSYDAALEFYKKALTIQQKVLTSQHPDVALTYANMASVYAAKNRTQQALTYWHKSIDVFRLTFPAKHPLLIKVEEEMQRASSKLTNPISPVKKLERKRLIVT